MPKFIAVIIFCLLLQGVSASPMAKKVTVKPLEISPEDSKVVAEMENLQLMDLANDMDMLKDLTYFIEDDKNGTQTH
jgi:hypothetical protein